MCRPRASEGGIRNAGEGARVDEGQARCLWEEDQTPLVFTEDSSRELTVDEQMFPVRNLSACVQGRCSDISNHNNQGYILALARSIIID
ncbi:hypothetical protein Tco_0586436 [Tanacetum coccineum]